MLKILNFLLCLLLSSGSVFSMEAYFDLKKFDLPGGESYVETQLSFVGSSVSYTTLDNGFLSSQIESTIIISQNGNIIDFRKIIIESPEVSDTTLVDFMDVQRFSLKPGKYQIEISLKDLFSPEITEQKLEQEFELTFVETRMEFSDIMLIKAFSKAQEASELTKSGYDMIPYVSDYYASNQNVLAFYTELYRTSPLLQDSMFLLTYYIAERGQDVVVGEFQKLERAKVKAVIPMLHMLDIVNLPTGRYDLVVEARNRMNEPIVSKRISFTRNNFLKVANEENIALINIDQTFVVKYNDRDSLVEYLNSCHPISTNLERSTVQNQMQLADLATLQKYFYYFWCKRDERNPEQAWNDYLEQVKFVNRAYGTRIMKGYQTDRGRVYLQYGPPNTIVQRYQPVNVLPYEIWHYYKINQFNNKRFLFYSRESVGVDFVLLHSDMLGEVQNNDWPVVMRTKNVEVSSSESSRNRSGARDTFSGDELEDLFYNPR